MTNNFFLPSIISVALLGSFAARPGLAAEQSTLPMTKSQQGVSPAASLGPLAARYIVPSARSVKTANTNVATVIRIINTGNATCNYLVRFTPIFNNTSICDVSSTSVAPWGSAIFCSRAMPDGSGADIAPCLLACNPEIVFNDAKALIFSTNSTACAAMAVDVIQAYTDTNDTMVQGVRSPAIVKVDPADVAKANKGD